MRVGLLFFQRKSLLFVTSEMISLVEMILSNEKLNRNNAKHSVSTKRNSSSLRFERTDALRGRCLRVSRFSFGFERNESKIGMLELCPSVSVKKPQL